MAELIIGLEKGKPSKGKSKDDPMGGEPAPDSTDDLGDMDSFDAALDDAWDAVVAKDKEGFKSALGAAISAKCAELYEDR